jgi:hypothetical protein
MLIDFIIDDIEIVCFNGSFSHLSKNKIKREVNLRYSLVKNGKSVFKESATNILYKKSADKRYYIYYIIEAFLTLNVYEFNYKAYEYCEQRIVKKNTEQWFMFHCLKKIVDKEKDISRNALCCVLRTLILIEYPTETTMDIERMVSYIEKARYECLKFYDYPSAINEICDLYTKEIYELWEQIIKEG